MRPRHGLATLIAALAATGLVGCDERPTPAASTAPAEGYVDSAQELFQPLGRLASAISGRAEDPEGSAPSRESLDEIITEADDALARFRVLPVADPGLRAQQRRLVEGYESVRARMDAAADSLAAGDAPPALARASAGFFDAVDAMAADLREAP
ncbi:MAG: hypothetical protein RIB67_10975 [Miltoncostaeaceae bacterium]